jgi:hypothetical protein
MRPTDDLSLAVQGMPAMIRRYATSYGMAFLVGALGIAAQAGLHAAEHPLAAPAPLMICDCWEGLGVYHSDDADKWTKQTAKLLDKPGRRWDDKGNGAHCSVITQGDRAFIFYQCGAGVQVAELKLENGTLTCDRDAAFNFTPQWSLAPEFRGGGGR